MKKVIVGMAAAAALVASTLAPQPVKADPISAWWLLPAFLGGLVVAGTWHHNPAYAAPRGAYYEYPAYGPAPRGAYYAEPRGQVYARGTVRSRY
ncbi:MAG: hypothetical protein IT539_03155 [Bradyrhizobiaceae bacterium]|nr:hypothetical protein [Bradyrhizobiaceae bacterium]